MLPYSALTQTGIPHLRRDKPEDADDAAAQAQRRLPLVRLRGARLLPRPRHQGRAQVDVLREVQDDAPPRCRE